MRVIVFGASGLVGKGTLLEVLAAPEVTSVLSIGRRTCGVDHPKLRELNLENLADVGAAEDHLHGFDACLWAVGISSLGLDEPAYAEVTETLTLTWAKTLLRINPGLSFCYCSAAGAGGKAMWARVRQRVEGALKAMPFRYAGAVRPAFIRPGKGLRSRTAIYQAAMVLLAPFFPLFLRAFPGLFTTSEVLGRAMLRVAQGRSDRFILESGDINRIGS